MGNHRIRLFFGEQVIIDTGNHGQLTVYNGVDNIRILKHGKECKVSLAKRIFDRVE